MERKIIIEQESNMYYIYSCPLRDAAQHPTANVLLPLRSVRVQQELLDRHKTPYALPVAGQRSVRLWLRNSLA